MKPPSGGVKTPATSLTVSPGRAAESAAASVANVARARGRGTARTPATAAAVVAGHTSSESESLLDKRACRR